MNANRTRATRQHVTSFWGLLAALTFLGVFCGGCETVEPRYNASRVVFDPGLVGWWQEVPKADPSTPDSRDPAPLHILARKAKMEEGRFVGGEAGTTPPPGSPTLPYTEAYIVHLEEGPTKQQFQAADLWAVLLKAGEERLVGVQPRVPNSGPFSTPYHTILRIKRDGDTLRVWAPKYNFAWMPQVQMLDPPDTGAPSNIPTLDELDKRKDAGMFLTLDPDRLLEVYSHYASDPGFWHDNAAVFRRIPAPSAPSDPSDPDRKAPK